MSDQQPDRVDHESPGRQVGVQARQAVAQSRPHQTSVAERKLIRYNTESKNRPARCNTHPGIMHIQAFPYIGASNLMGEKVCLQ